MGTIKTGLLQTQSGIHFFRSLGQDPISSRVSPVMRIRSR